MKYSEEISTDAREIGGHFDDNIFVFFQILWPVVPFLLLYRLEPYIVPDHLVMLAGPALKFLQYWAGCAIAYHWMNFCLTGNTPGAWWRVLFGPAKFWAFFGVVIFFRIGIDLDKILFFALKDNHAFIEYFNTVRYGIIAAYVGIVYLVFRAAFVLPMLASGAAADFAASWRASARDAYVVILSGLRAALPYLIAVALLPGVIRALIELIFKPGQESTALIFYMALYMPVELLLVPILLTLGASTVAYHYRERVLEPASAA